MPVFQIFLSMKTNWRLLPGLSNTRRQWHGTDTLPNAKARYLPLVTARGSVGVIAISSTDSSKELTIEQQRILEAYADLVVVIESVLLSQERRNS